MSRVFYSADISDFLRNTKENILAGMVQNNPFDLNDLQRDAWIEEICILKDQLNDVSNGRILLEYTIPRMGKRVDAVLLTGGVVFLFEFKVGAREFHKSIFDQVMDYALDLKNFQKACKNLRIIPVAIPTEAEPYSNNYRIYEDGVAYPIGANKGSIGSVISEVLSLYKMDDFDYAGWENADYMPTPTIVEAAQALYNHHNVSEITRTDAGAKNLQETTEEIKNIISESKKDNKKAIIFVTGVPGAGKTLVGLNLANTMHCQEEDTCAVLLSGNSPLVAVLQQALVNDKIKREKEKGNKISEATALREVKSFIQEIHNYRDEYIDNDRIPPERIAIFDEAQRAWTKGQISSFMARRKRIKNFNYSEPEFLIGTMNRLTGWAVIVCLVGGGQEIDRGEAGLSEWFASLRRSFPEWNVYSSPNLNDSDYLRGITWEEMTARIKLNERPELHLSTSMRSFRSERVSLFVKQLLDNSLTEAQETYRSICDRYPIYLTRNLEKAKQWVKEKSRGSERYGLLCSSKAKRLKHYGIYYAKDAIDAPMWFLKGKNDIRSGYMLEIAASEFETQGLELDYAVVAWDADYRIENGVFECYSLSNRLNPPNWSRMQSKNNRLYLKNSYRVLLTRARQGFVIFIPEGDSEDATRRPEFYDQTYEYLKMIGIREI